MLKNVIVIYPVGSLRSGRDRHITNHRDVEHRMKFVIECDDNSSAEEQLEVLWRYCNIVDDDEVEKQLRDYAERSMMVGDMAEIDGDTYRCAYVGWTKM